MSKHIDLAAIKDAYARMQDDELLSFAHKEGLHLTGDAFLILRDEIKKRNIGENALEELERDVILRASIQSQKVTEGLVGDLYQEAVEYSLSQKENGASDYDIYKGLVEMGIDEGEANHMVHRIDKWAEKLDKDASVEMMIGFAIVTLGIIALFAASEIGYFAWGGAFLLLGGIVRAAASARKKAKAKRILNHFRQGA